MKGTLVLRAFNKIIVKYEIISVKQDTKCSHTGVIAQSNSSGKTACVSA